MSRSKWDARRVNEAGIQPVRRTRSKNRSGKAKARVQDIYITRDCLPVRVLDSLHRSYLKTTDAEGELRLPFCQVYVTSVMLGLDFLPLIAVRLRWENSS